MANSIESKGASAFGGDATDVFWAIAAVASALVTTLAYIFVFEGASRQGGLLLAAAFGATMGWVLGVLSTPYNSAEAKRLGGVSKVIYAAMSGYLLAKIDPIIGLVVGTETAPGVHVEFLPHVAIALIMTCATAMLTYVTRSYASEARRLK